MDRTRKNRGPVSTAKEVETGRDERKQDGKGKHRVYDMMQYDTIRYDII